MAKVKGFPGNQSFNITGRRNLTKKNSWWQHAPFHNNGANRSAKKSQSI